MISLASQVSGRSVNFQPRVVYLYGSKDFDTLDYFGAAFVGLVVFFLVFVITIVSFLNERSQGTLERLMASPLRRGEIVLGYMLGFTVLALIQSAEVLVFALAVLKIHNQGNVLLIFGMEALMAIAAVNLGNLPRLDRAGGPAVALERAPPHLCRERDARHHGQGRRPDLIRPAARRGGGRGRLRPPDRRRQHHSPPKGCMSRGRGASTGDSVIQAAQLLGACEHRSERIR